MLNCTKDSDCDTRNCQYCLSNGMCGNFEKDYCNRSRCGRGDGNCNPDFNLGSYIINGCRSGFKCGENNFLTYHPELTNCTTWRISQNDIMEANSCYGGKESLEP